MEKVYLQDHCSNAIGQAEEVPTL